jgi:hypothetical protein
LRVCQGGANQLQLGRRNRVAQFFRCHLVGYASPALQVSQNCICRAFFKRQAAGVGWPQDRLAGFRGSIVRGGVLKAAMP